MKITVVYAIGGDAIRFGGKYKPFLKVFDKYFIQASMEPFLKHIQDIDKFIFVVNEGDFDFTAEKLHEFIPNWVNYRIIPIKKQKSIIKAIYQLRGYKDLLLNDVIFCDCDHAVNVDSLFEAIKKRKYDCVVPVWNIDENEIHKWGVASIEDDFYVIDIAEKKLPERKGWMNMGVIGCYYFKQFPAIEKGTNLIHFSDVIRTYIGTGKWVQSVVPSDAEFYGDPERLMQLYVSKKANTIFCDLDGTFIKHENVPDYSKLEILPGAIEKLNEWRNEHSFIIFTTSRDELFRNEMQVLLKESKIRYEYLIMGLPPGPRHIINDKKPYSDSPMAVAHEVERDKGIKDIELNSYSGAEFKASEKLFYKTTNDPELLPKLLLQGKSMKIFAREMPKYFPKFSHFTENGYVIERLKGYKPISEFDSIDFDLEIYDKLVEFLDCLYSDYKIVNGIKWVSSYLQEKIYKKLPLINELLPDHESQIKGIISVFHDIEDESLIDEFEPKIMYRYHGDLTFSNILWNKKKKKLKIIDPDNEGGEYGPLFLDVGKLLQSSEFNYEFWGIKESCDDITCIINDYFISPKLHQGFYFATAYFAAASHLFRMIPYQAKKDKNRAIMALNKCTEAIENLKEEIEYIKEYNEENGNEK